MLLTVVVVAISGCIEDACDVSGKTVHDEVANAAPGAVLTLALEDCSTCGHTRATGKWSLDGFNPGTTGHVEVQLSPKCLVRDTTVMANPLDGEGVADTNVKNCGEIVGYNAYVTNRTNMTLLKMELTLVCPTLAE